MKNLFKALESSKVKLLVIIGIFFILLPIFAFSDSKMDIYVDANASGKKDGSEKHPYSTISDAVKNAPQRNVRIHVAKGKYKDNVELKEDMELYGESQDGVIIEASDDDSSAVIMGHETEVNKVTVKGGKYGIYVKKNSEVSIINCTVKDNDKDGIHIAYADVKENRKATISKSKIYNNDKAGIYSEKRRIVIENTSIYDNGGDGIDLNAGSKAWIYDNYIHDNNKSGMKLVIDGSSIWTRSNDIEDNDREGIEVNFYGGTGRINIDRSSIENNNRYGVARVQRNINSINTAAWNSYLTFDPSAKIPNRISGNDLGNISEIVLIKK